MENKDISPVASVSPPPTKPEDSTCIVDAIREQPNESEWQMPYGEACALIDNRDKIVARHAVKEIRAELRRACDTITHRNYEIGRLQDIKTRSDEEITRLKAEIDDKSTQLVTAWASAESNERTRIIQGSRIMSLYKESFLLRNKLNEALKERDRYDSEYFILHSRWADLVVELAQSKQALEANSLFSEAKHVEIVNLRNALSNAASSLDRAGLDMQAQSAYDALQHQAKNGA